MSYLNVPYSASTVVSDQYTDGVIIAKLESASFVSKAIKVVKTYNTPINATLYTSDGTTNIMFSSIRSDATIQAIYYDSQSDMYTSLISNPNWLLGDDTHYYTTVDVSAYADIDWTLVIEPYDSLSAAFSGLVGGASNRVIMVSVVYKTADTNEDAGTSETGGGDGNFDDTSDNIPLPTIPIISAAASGLVTLFRPNEQQLKDLSAYLWTNLSAIADNLAKLFSNPMDYIIAFNIVPCVPDVGTSRNIKVGLLQSDIMMPPVLSQWQSVSLGVCTCRQYWGSALDYSPYTKISLFLPFIGTVELNTDEVMGNEIGIDYNIDLLSGQCVALVTVNNNVYYQYSGQCAISIPVTASDFSRIYSAAIGAIGTALTGGISAANAGAAAGGATAALAGVSAARSVNNIAKTFVDTVDYAKGAKGVQGIRNSLQQAADLALQSGNNAANITARVSGGIQASRLAGAINNTVSQVMSGKAYVHHSGTIAGSSGMLGVRTPYLIIEYPNQSLADNYKHFVGYPSNITSVLGSLSGFTQVEQVELKGVLATDSELEQIQIALKEGVYI